MADELSEQTAEVQQEQTTDVVEEQTSIEAAPEDNESAAPEGDGAAPEPVVPQFQTDEDLRSFLESNERARSFLEKYKNDQFNAAKQKVEAELRRKAATDEQVAAWTQRFAEKAGIDSLTPEQRAEVVAVLDARGEYLWTSKLRGFNEDAVKYLGDDNPDLQAAFQQVYDSYGDDQEAWQVATNRMAEALVAKGKRDTLANLTLDQVPEGSKLQQEIQERVRKEVETELAARALEAGKRDTPPRVNGRPASGGLTEADIDNMTPEQINDRWDEVQKVLRGEGVAAGA